MPPRWPRLPRVRRAAILAQAAAQVAQLAAGAARGAYQVAGHRSFPIVQGRLPVSGISGPIEVIRDRHGVPHILAGPDEDVVFGQGFVHAQDRLFQMDGLRRLAAGRLAEIGGAASLPSDRMMRRFGVGRAARRDVAEMRPEHRALLDAYARGVNEAMRTMQALPPEFAIIGYEPEPWRAEDTMLVGRLLLFGFAGNWDTELQRERLAHALGPERAAALDSVHPPLPTMTGRPYEGAAERLVDAYRAAVPAGALPVSGASNAFAVVAERSLSGAPLLAADPHVPAGMPCLFHVSHLRGDGLDAIGAVVPGLPGAAIGHNGRIAWGLTVGMANVADCYVEEFQAGQARRYRTPAGWGEAVEHVERIEVRGGGAIEERVLATRHGPVVTPVVPGETRAVAVRSTAFEGGGVVRAFLGMSRARDLEEFEAALDAWSGTTFNILFATVDGRIGCRMVGSVPAGAPGEGLLPRDGASSPGPPAPITGRDLPRLIDPASGLVVSANQAPGGNRELGEEWHEPKRAERIAELIEVEPRHSAGSFAGIQVDRHSDHLVRLRDLLLLRGAVALPEGPLLEAWDGQLAPGDPAAAVIGLVYEELARTLAERVAGPHGEIVLGRGLRELNPHSAFQHRLQGTIVRATLAAEAPWYDGVEDRDGRLIAAVNSAVETLHRRFGPRPSQWRWGTMHPLVMSHPLKPVPGLGRWFSRGPFEFGGDLNTVVQANFSMHRPDAETWVSPGYRQVIDLGDVDRSTFILPTGSSGIPGHPRYDDCIPDYLAGRQRPLLFSRAAIEGAAESRLVLDPGAGASDDGGGRGP